MRHSTSALAFLGCVIVFGPDRATACQENIFSGPFNLVFASAATALPATVSPGPPAMNPAHLSDTDNYAISVQSVIPLGLSDLIAHKAGGVIRLGGGVFSLEAGRLGYDRLRQTRYSAAGALHLRSLTRNARGAVSFAVGGRVTTDRYVQAGMNTVTRLQTDLGLLVDVDAHTRFGATLSLGDGESVSGYGSSYRFGASYLSEGALSFLLGWQHRSVTGSHLAGGLIARPVPYFTIGLGAGNNNQRWGMVTSLMLAGIHVRLAWSRAAPVGATKNFGLLMEPANE